MFPRIEKSNSKREAFDVSSIDFLRRRNNVEENSFVDSSTLSKIEVLGSTSHNRQKTSNKKRKYGGKKKLYLKTLKNSKTSQSKRKNYHKKNFIPSSTIEDLNFLRHIQNLFVNQNPNSFVESLKHSRHLKSKERIPTSNIPKEFYIYSSNPLISRHSLNLSLQKKRIIENEFENEKSKFERLIFPSHFPSKRIEIFLLGRTLDVMIENIEKEFPDKTSGDSTDNDSTKIVPEKIKKKYQIHTMALHEMARQVATTCFERGFMIKKIAKYFENFFLIIKTILTAEKKKCNNFQIIINDYENLISEIEIEKIKTRREMELLLKEKTKLYLEREALKRKTKDISKYEYLMKLIDNENLKEEIRRVLKQSLSTIEYSNADGNNGIVVDEDLDDPFYKEKKEIQKKMKALRKEEKIQKKKIKKKKRNEEFKSLLEKQKYETELKLMKKTCEKSLNFIIKLSKVLNINFPSSSTIISKDSISPMGYLYEINSKLHELLSCLKRRKEKIYVKFNEVQNKSGKKMINVFFHTKENKELKKVEQKNYYLRKEKHDLLIEHAKIKSKLKSYIEKNNEITIKNNELRDKIDMFKKSQSSHISVMRKEIRKKVEKEQEIKEIEIEEQRNRLADEIQSVNDNMKLEREVYEKKIKKMEHRIEFERKLFEKKKVNLIHSLEKIRTCPKIDVKVISKNITEILEKEEKYVRPKTPPSPNSVEEVDEKMRNEKVIMIDNEIKRMKDEEEMRRKKGKIMLKKIIEDNDGEREGEDEVEGENERENDPEVIKNAVKKIRKRKKRKKRKSLSKRKKKNFGLKLITKSNVVPKNETEGEKEEISKWDDSDEEGIARPKSNGRKKDQKKKKKSQKSLKKKNSSQKLPKNVKIEKVKNEYIPVNVLKNSKELKENNSNELTLSDMLSNKEKSFSESVEKAEKKVNKKAKKEKYQKKNEIFTKRIEKVNTGDLVENEKDEKINVEISRLFDEEKQLFESKTEIFKEMLNLNDTSDVKSTIKEGDKSVKKQIKLYESFEDQIKKRNKIILKFQKRIENLKKKISSEKEINNIKKNIGLFNNDDEDEFFEKYEKNSEKDIKGEKSGKSGFKKISIVEMPIGKNSKSLIWLLKLISHVYPSFLREIEKKIFDLNFAQFMYAFVKNLYGVESIVKDICSGVMKTIKSHRLTDKRIKIFGSFISGKWPNNVLIEFLKVWKAMREISVGPKYTSHFKDERIDPLRTSKVKVLYVLSILKEVLPKINLENVVNGINDCCVVERESVYQKGMVRAGYKLKGLDGFNARKVWGISEESARQSLLEVDFLEIICNECEEFYGSGGMGVGDGVERKFEIPKIKVNGVEVKERGKCDENRIVFDENEWKEINEESKNVFGTRSDDNKFEKK